MDRIKGITVEIGGDTTKLSQALSGVNKSIRETQSQLKDVDRLLKLDPKNTELLKQKQELLAKAINDTKSKLDTLKTAQQQMDANGVDKNSEQYQKLQREIIATEQDLKKLEKQAKNSNVMLQQISAAGDSFKKVGKNIEGVGKALTPLSAAAGGMVTGLAGLGYKAVTTADDLNTLSKQTGISTDDLQKMTYASDRIDVSLDTITGSSQAARNRHSEWQRV